MPFTLEFLWTDRLIYLLLAVVAVLVWHVRRHEHLRAPWRKVARSASGMSAATVLACFVVIGLLDSVHYRPAIAVKDGKSIYAVEVLSLLDAIAAPLRQRREKTYSAPLATHLYSKETMTQPDGREVRDFPRLRHGGAHLKNPDTELVPDLAWRALLGLVLGAILWMLLAALLCAALAWRGATRMRLVWRAVWRGETGIAWRAVLATAAVILAVATPLVLIAGSYHVFGTDKVGQDVFYQALKSIRTGLVIGTLTTLVMLPFALSNLSPGFQYHLYSTC